MFGWLENRKIGFRIALSARFYPEAGKHQRQHEGFIKRLHRLHEEYRGGRREAGTDLLNLLAGWWQTHISTFDARLAEFMRERGSLARRLLVA